MHNAIGKRDASQILHGRFANAAIAGHEHGRPPGQGAAEQPAADSAED